MAGFFHMLYMQRNRKGVEMKTHKDVQILCDMDDTIVDLMPRWLELYAEGGKCPCPHIDSITQWELEPMFEYPQRLWFRLPEALRTAQPKPEVLDVIKQYASQVTLVTTVAAKCNPAEITEAKIAWLCKNWAGSKFPGFNVSASPQQRANEQGDVLVDDNPANVEIWLASRPDRTAVLIDMPWNRDFAPAISRCIRFGHDDWSFTYCLNWAIDHHLELASAGSGKVEEPSIDIDTAYADKVGGYSEASKNDSNKPQLSLIPRAALNELARGFAYGANKYGRYNFEKGHQYSRLVDAALRHLSAIAAGEFIDSESGNTHLSHALCSLAMLAHSWEYYPEKNDLNRK